MDNDIIWVETHIKYYSDEDLGQLEKAIVEEKNRRENVGEELRYKVNISYEGNKTKTSTCYEYKDDKNVNYACWDTSGYGGVYAVSNKSEEHAKKLATKCFKEGAGCVHD